MNPMKYIRYLMLMAAMTVAMTVTAESFLPLLHNYSKADYNAALQNWDLAQGRRGEIYVGNGLGVLCYDGYLWSLTPLPGKAVARSLMMDGDRLYVGSYMDFGYMERDDYGVLQYTSLWPKGYEGHDDEIWNIVRDSEGIIYFQSFSGYFSYDGKNVTPHYDNSMRPLYFHEVRGRIYVQIQNDDYYLLTGNKLVPVVSRKQVGNDHIVAAAPGRPGHVILCTQWHGLFDYDGSRCVPFFTAADEQLRVTNVNRATFLAQDSTLVIGTILGGIYGIVMDGKLRWHYHMGNHLNNNSVLNLMSDCDGNVWAALDIGIALINTASPYSLLTPDNGRLSIGMVYDVAAVPPYLYIATNQAAWRYSTDSHELVRVGGSDGQNWHVTRVQDKLLLGNNDGVKLLNGTSTTLIPGAQSSSTCVRTCVLNGQEVMIESTYYALRVYVKRNGQWVFSHEIENFHAPVSQFEVDLQGNIWAAHMSCGLFRLELSPDLRRTNVRSYRLVDEDSLSGLTHVMKVCGRVLFTRGHRFYTYDDMHRKIVPFEEMGDLGSEICAATMVDDATFWLASSDGFLLMKRDSDGYHSVGSVSSGFFGLDCNDNKNNVYVNDHIAYFNLNNGVGRLDMRELDTGQNQNGTKKLSVRSVTTSGRKVIDEPMPVNTTAKKRASSLASVAVTLSYPNFDYRPLVFSFNLKGAGNELVTESSDPQVSYSALGFGDYCLNCKVKTLSGEVIDELDYYFCHPRPFYASWWAWILYALMLIALAYLLVRYRTRKTEERLRRQFEDKRLQQDFKMLEQEKIIAEQRHQLLEAQLNDKAKEAASLALDAAARNQAIENIRETLREKRRKGAISQNDMAVMLAQLGENADSDNFWEIYQNNFNLIHKNFFKNLKAQYPSLTSTDLRFCALLRLNLSTKDIAQFTGLSVRGVEGARYRLRKKFNLHEGSDLVDFLINYE
jgi:ligand-binding sensor domain-containing protein/DNA-binding CsgD family transcriptional regulator